MRCWCALLCPLLWPLLSLCVSDLASLSKPVAAMSRVVVIPEFDDTSYQEIEAELRGVLNRSNILTPDDVRGSYATLSDAVLPSRG